MAVPPSLPKLHLIRQCPSGRIPFRTVKLNRPRRLTNARTERTRRQRRYILSTASKDDRISFGLRNFFACHRTTRTPAASGARTFFAYAAPRRSLACDESSSSITDNSVASFAHIGETHAHSTDAIEPACRYSSVDARYIIVISNRPVRF